MVAKKQIKTTGQHIAQLNLSLDELDKHPGKAVLLAAEADDIGAELLSILSKGLYTNPLDCIREYAQNGVDAGARSIRIKITGNAVSILDDGAGMEREDMLAARRFGLSPKSITEHVGFRGIGLYSGFDICRELSIRSSKAGSTRVHNMVFKFADMKAQLDTERLQDSSKKRTSLVDLLSKHTQITLLPEEEDKDRSYTLVTLQDVSPEHVALFSDQQRMRNYLLANLPIDFSSTFPHQAEISKALREKLGVAYKPVKVNLQLPGRESLAIEKYASIGSLQAPTFHSIYDDDKLIAFVWVCLNNIRKTVDLNRKESDPEYAGLLFKMKGFSIGTRDKARTLFSRPQIYDWYTGEIYITNPAVIPNAERNDFETSAAKRVLMVELEELAETLTENADKFSLRENAKESLAKHGAMLNKLDSIFGSADSPVGQFDEAMNAYRDLGDVLKDLKKRKKAIEMLPTDQQTLATDINLKAKKYQVALEKLIKEPAAVFQNKKKSVKKGTSSTAAVGQKEIHEMLAEDAPPKLIDVFQNAGWTIKSPADVIIELFQSALDDLIKPGSTEYKNFINYLSEKIADNNLEK